MTFQAGERVRITNSIDERLNWVGLEFVVKRAYPGADQIILDDPDGNRPDEYKGTWFYWDTKDLVLASAPTGPVVKDTLGKVIRVGDRVVYPVRSGSWMAVRDAKVVDVGSVTKSRYNYRDKTSTPYEEPFLKVEAQGKRWKRGEDGQPGKYVPYTYKATIVCVGRVTVVDRA